MTTSPRRADYDAVVVGLGALGSATLYRLARAGARVAGIEQFELNHDRGASQDESRIIRLSYRRPEYVELAKLAYGAWREVEAAAGVTIVTTTGGIDIAPPNAAESIDDYADAMSAAGVPFDWLTAADVVRRWPQWRLDPETRAIFQGNAGIADPSVGNPAHQRLAVQHGATIIEQARVQALREGAGEVQVELAGGATLTAGSVVLAADAWTNQLLAPLGRSLPLHVTLEQVTWLEPREPASFAASSFPIWIWLDLPSFYGFPAHRRRGPKIGEDVGGRETTADGRSFEPDPAVLARLEQFIERHLPNAFVRVSAMKTCLYTLTPDRDFVIDRLPEAPGIVVALGAAHSYKFAALLGQRLAELALDRTRQPATDLALFAVDRPALAGAA